MSRVHRIVTTSLIALAIAITGIQMAMARGQSPAVGYMVLCTGTGPVQVLVDENGQPTGKVSICPDYALHALASLDVPDIEPAVAPVTWHEVRANHTRVKSGPQAYLVPLARGPPVHV